MKTTRRREILIEKEEIAILINESGRGYRKCPFCREASIMLAPSVIAEVLRISSREIYKLIEADRVHFIEDEKKSMFVCVKNFSEKFFDRRKPVLKKPDDGEIKQ